MASVGVRGCGYMCVVFVGCMLVSSGVHVSQHGSQQMEKTDWLGVEKVDDEWRMISAEDDFDDQTLLVNGQEFEFKDWVGQKSWNDQENGFGVKGGPVHHFRTIEDGTKVKTSGMGMCSSIIITCEHGGEKKWFFAHVYPTVSIIEIDRYVWFFDMRKQEGCGDSEYEWQVIAGPDQFKKEGADKMKNTAKECPGGACGIPFQNEIIHELLKGGRDRPKWHEPNQILHSENGKATCTLNADSITPKCDAKTKVTRANKSVYYDKRVHEHTNL